MAQTKPKTAARARPLTNAEHQARWRQRRAARLARAEQLLAAHGLTIETSLRKTGRVGNLAPLRKTNPEPGEARDAQLTQLRQRSDQLLADYLAFVKTSGLSPAEATTIDARYADHRRQVAKAVKARPRLTVVPRSGAIRGGRVQ